MIAAPRVNVPPPAALANVFPSPPATPLEAAEQAGVRMVGLAKACEQQQDLIGGHFALAAGIAGANKQLARTGHVYGWEHLPGRKQKEYR